MAPNFNELYESTGFKVLGQLLSNIVEINGDIYNVQNYINTFKEDGSFKYAKVRQKTYDLLYPYYLIPNNNNLKVFIDNIEVIKDICKVMSNDINDILHAKLNSDDKDTKKKISVFTKDINILKEKAGF